MEMKSAEVVRNAEERKAFYARIDGDNLAPLWEVLKGLVPAEPKPAAAPHLRDYDAIRPRIFESGGGLHRGQWRKTLMHEGDFGITPSWTWPDPGNDSPDPMVWLDVLHLSTVAHFHGHPTPQNHPLDFPKTQNV